MVVNDRDLGHATLDAVLYLNTTNDPPRLFHIGDVPVRVEPHPDDERPITRDLTEARLVYELANAIQFVRLAKHGAEHPANPPIALARNVLATPELPFPPLDRIVEVPVFARDGSLCLAPGYHPDARVLYHQPDGLSVDVPRHPSDHAIATARTLISDELLGDFPFVSESDRAHAVAALLLPFVRDLIDGPTPLHLFEKPTEGTGGSLLAQVVLRPALGRPLPAMAAGRDDEEWRKRLTAALGQGAVAVLFDNVVRLDSPALAAALTTTIWVDRQLGVSRVVQLPVRCVWLATANNPALSREVVRRTVRIRLDAGTAQPWLRKGFHHPDLTAWTMAHRSELVSAALTLIQCWIDRGRPKGAHPRLGTFEAWSDAMGGILHCCGIQGFLGDLEAFYAAAVDDEAAAWQALADAWWARYGDTVVGVTDIWLLTQGPGAVDLDLGDKNEKSQRIRLGKLLGRMRDRIFDARRVVAAKPVKGVAQWRLVPAVTASATATSASVPEWVS